MKGIVNTSHSCSILTGAPLEKRLDQYLALFPHLHFNSIQFGHQHLSETIVVSCALGRPRRAAAH